MAGFSSHTDAATRHPDADAVCWWCWKPVLSRLHDYSACHTAFLPRPRARAEKRAVEVAEPQPDPQGSLW